MKGLGNSDSWLGEDLSMAWAAISPFDSPHHVRDIRHRVAASTVPEASERDKGRVQPNSEEGPRGPST
jgi:hypothetical protein